MQEGKGLSEETLQTAEEWWEVKGKWERETYSQLIAGFQRIAKRDKKGFLNEQCKEIEENNRMGKLKISSRKLEISGNIWCKDGHSKEMVGT